MLRVVMSEESDTEKRKDQADDLDDPNELAERLNRISVEDESDPDINILLCDAGYGFPREKVPRREKVNAVASQLSNYLSWQTDDNTRSKRNNLPLAGIQVVGCPDEKTKIALEQRLLENMKIPSLPDHVKFSCESLQNYLSNNGSTGVASTAVYLSPDADESMDPTKLPPQIAVVGLLIDRRIQPNRSKNRASKLNIVAKRWRLEECFAGISPCEPLNVDCIMEGMQQWWWNCHRMKQGSKEFFVQAASQAIDHHAKRHPSRPLHIPRS